MVSAKKLSIASLYIRLRRLLKPLSPPNQASLPLAFSTQTHEPTKKTDNSPVITQAVEILQNTDEGEWNQSILHQILFSSTAACPLNSRHLLQITRQLGTTNRALNFLHWLRANSADSPILSSTFQAIFELAIKELDSRSKLVDLLRTSREYDIPLTINSAILLVRLFGRTKMVEESISVFNELDPSHKNTHVRNVLIDVLCESGRHEHALQILDEMVLPNSQFPPNKSTVDIIFSAFLSKENRVASMNGKEIVDLVSELGERGFFPNSVQLSRSITDFCKNRKRDLAWDVLHVVMKLGGPVEAAPCNALLSGLGRHRDFDRMNILLSEMKENGIDPNLITFGILINHLCKFHRVEEALQVFEKMSLGKENNGFSMKPDVVIYNTLIDGLCKVGKKEEGLALMEQMETRHNCTPNVVTYNCLIDGFCKSGEIEASFKLFDKMKKEGVTPNVVTLNTLVDGMCRHRRINQAMQFLYEMQEGGLKGNIVTYTTLINAFCNANNINKALDLFDEMLKAECMPDPIVYYTLISGLCLAGRLDDAGSVVSKMKSAGFSLDLVCYNVLIDGFCKRNKLDKAYQMLKEMEEAGMKPDTVTYNTLISYFSKMGDLVTARRLMKKMRIDGIVPTVVTYGILVHAYCSSENIDEAMKIVKGMSSASRVLPNTVIYNMLIDCLCKNQRVELALSLMDEMEVKGVKPNTNTFNGMFKGLKDKNMLEKAIELMDKMTAKACKADYITVEILTEWLPVVGQTERLRRFLQGYVVSVSTTKNQI